MSKFLQRLTNRWNKKEKLQKRELKFKKSVYFAIRIQTEICSIVGAWSLESFC